MNACRREVATSDISGDKQLFAEDVGELCTIDDDMQYIGFIGFVPGSEHLSEAAVNKEEDSYSLEEEEIIECDPIGVVECDPIGDDTLSLVMKSEEDAAPKRPEDAIHTSKGPDKIPHKQPPKEVQRRKISNCSNEQLKALERTFKQTSYPDCDLKQNLAARLGLTYTDVCRWFTNKRRRIADNIRKSGSKKPNLGSSKRAESTLLLNPEDRGSISLQAGGSSSPPRDGVQSPPMPRRYKQKPIDEPSKEPVNGSSTSKNSRGLRSFTKTCPGQSEPSRQAEHCQVCDRVPQGNKLRNLICSACDSFMKRFKSKTRGRVVVPHCSHKGTQVLSGCRGCRFYRYRQVAMKRRAVSQPKMAQNQPAVLNCKTTSEHKNAPASTNINLRRRSGRFLARTVASGEGFSESQTVTTSDEYPMDLQKKLYVTGKLNKLRSIAITLSNPEQMETEDRLVLSDELNGCVNDLLSLVLATEPPASKTKENLPSTKEPCPAEPLLPNTTNKTCCPSLVRQIQSLGKVVKESITRLEGQMKNSVRKETSTQTDAYLLFSFVSQSDNVDEPPSLSDGQPHYRNYSDPIRNVPPFGATQNSPISATRCQVCDQARPLGAVDHNFICTHCQWLMEKLNLSRPNRNLLVPRCAHRGTRASFGCNDCLVFRYNRVMSGLTPNLTQVELTSNQAKGSYGKNNGCHVPTPMNTSRMTPESHESTSSHHTHHLMPSYPPPLHTSPQVGNVQPAMSATTQLSLTLSQGDSTSEVIPYQRISANDKVPKSPLGHITKKCPAVYGRNYNGMSKWCEGCSRRKACTRFQ